MLLLHEEKKYQMQYAKCKCKIINATVDNSSKTNTPFILIKLTIIILFIKEHCTFNLFLGSLNRSGIDSIFIFSIINAL